MPKRPRPEPMPFSAMIAELVARAERGPPTAWEPNDAAPVRRYRPPRYFRHPGQLPFLFPKEPPDKTPEIVPRAHNSRIMTMPLAFMEFSGLASS